MGQTGKPGQQVREGRLRSTPRQHGGGAADDGAWPCHPACVRAALCGRRCRGHLPPGLPPAQTASTTHQRHSQSPPATSAFPSKQNCGGDSKDVELLHRAWPLATDCDLVGHLHPSSRRLHLLLCLRPEKTEISPGRRPQLQILCSKEQPAHRGASGGQLDLLVCEQLELILCEHLSSLNF